MKFNLSIGLALLLFIAGTTVSAQKRGKKGKSTSSDVLNMTFERLQEDEEVSELGSITLLDNGVFSPTENAADLFQKGAGTIAGVPNNAFGNEESDVDGGKVYAGFVAYKPGRESSLRSYITIPFLKGKGNVSLSKGLKYCIQFKVSLAESSKYACNNIGAYFTKEAPSSKSGIINAPENLIRGKNNRIHQGFFGWDQVCEIYTAKGDEKFITIGNFDKNDNTKWIPVKKPKTAEVEVLKHAYYYIDNVTVKQIDSDEDCNCVVNSQAAHTEEYSTLIYTKAIHVEESMSTAEKVAAQELFYGFGKKDFTPNSKESLKFIAGVLKADPNVSLEVHGHSDSQEEGLGASKEEFSDMGMVRANYVKRYFLANGIEDSRISVKSHRDTEVSREIAPSVDDEELKAAKSRRVEFKLN
ncbi:OmpA family protein [Crocinitomicaceae bacterium]|nr:OmpA family protein [Crocinitomicaceae bacterium]